MADASSNAVNTGPTIKLAPLIGPGENFESVTETIGSIVLQPRQPRSWIFGAFIAFCFLMLFFVAVSWLLIRGVGIWGINIPVAWGFAIVNFVWWIGIGHAGTFISAILLLLHQKWRTSINRLTEEIGRDTSELQ